LPPMTAEDLVRAVIATATASAPLVSGQAIEGWCLREAIDYGAGDHNSLFQAADFAEAAGQHRLLKFRRNNTQRNAEVFWALRADAPRALARIGNHAGRKFAHANGWVECVWSLDKWEWQAAQTPQP